MAQSLMFRLIFACVLASGYAQPLNAEPVRISGALPAGGNVVGYRLTPNGLNTVFSGDGDTNGVDEVYVVPTAGGVRTKLSGALVAGGTVASYTPAVSPDGSRVVFRAAKDTAQLFELYSAPITGGVVTKISAPLATGDWIGSDYVISADSSRVVFTVTTSGVMELYSVPIAGGIVTKLSGTLVAGGNVWEPYAISPDSSRVLFVADKDADEVRELYSVPIAGGSVTKLSGSLVTGTDVATDFVISPDSGRVVYRVGAVGVTELYSVPIAGGVVTYLASGYSYVISPDSSRAIFVCFNYIDQVQTLCSAPIAGGSIANLSGALVAGGSINGNMTRVSPDSSQVVFAASKDAVNKFELYSVPIAGGGVTNISGTMVAGGGIQRATISPDGSRVVFESDKETDLLFELYSVPIIGGVVTKLSSTITPNGGSYGSVIAPNSSRVVFRADRDTAGVFELYSVPMTGGVVTTLSGTLVAGGGVQHFAMSPNGSRAVFGANKDTISKTELYSTALISPAMDVDGNGVVDALTDGLLLIRWQFGLRGAALIAGAVGPNATRNTVALIEAYLTKLDTYSGPN